MMVETSRRPITLESIDTQTDSFKGLCSELLDLCEEMDIQLDDEQASLCVQHLLLVEQVNKYMNLTRIQDIHEALVLHVVDSLCLARELPFDPEKFLDMGTGAGFPGIPFGILSGSAGILLDSVGKKVDAVNAFARELGLDSLHAVHDRLENYAAKHKHEFDIVFARAVGQLPLIIEYGAPFLEEDGYLVLAKANPEPEEVTAGNKVAKLCGLELVGKDEFDLPRGLGHRTVFLYEKVGQPRIKLPRAVGMAKKSPLA